MNEPEKFTDYAAWHARCCDRGDEGPHYIVGAGGKRSQFVRDGEGTSAIWNHAAGWGYVFALADRDPTKQQDAATPLRRLRSRGTTENE